MDLDLAKFDFVKLLDDYERIINLGRPETSIHHTTSLLRKVLPDSGLNKDDIKIVAQIARDLVGNINGKWGSINRFMITGILDEHINGES